MSLVPIEAAEITAAANRQSSAVCCIDPLKDPRWAQLVNTHPRASIFHTTGWLEALRRTYGYEPVAFTTSAPDVALENGVVFCRVNSRLTGRRLVSLPFSDHCDALTSNSEDLDRLLARARLEFEVTGCRYLEVRPLYSWSEPPGCVVRSDAYRWHKLDLRPSLTDIFHGFHRTSVQRKIHRAEREKLIYEEGRSDVLVRKFYGLQLLTRRRHRLPPQPLAWFQHLAESMGPGLKLRVVSKQGVPIASMITIAHGSTLVYKYGCSDHRFHHLGGIQLLFWHAIQDGKREGLLELDLGRSDSDNEGLVRFKERLGATRGDLIYWRHPGSATTRRHDSWAANAAKRIFACLPDACLTVAGKMIYRHLG